MSEKERKDLLEAFDNHFIEQEIQKSKRIVATLMVVVVGAIAMLLAFLGFMR